MKTAEGRAARALGDIGIEAGTHAAMYVGRLLREHEADVRADERVKVDPDGILVEMVEVTKARRFCDDALGDGLAVWVERIANGADVALEAIEDRDMHDEEAYRIYRRCLVETGARVLAAIRSFDKQRAEGTLARANIDRSST